MFLRNSWYVAAMSHEVGRTLLARTLLNEPVVMYRTEAGKLVALEDRCPHRIVPLSMGCLVGEDRIQCGYHGIEFDPSGAAVRDPETKRSLPWATIRSYPIEEVYGWVFIWMGDSSLADTSKIPTFHKRMISPDCQAFGGYDMAKCNYLFAIDNLLTLSHLAYLHRNAGAPEFAEEPIRKLSPVHDAALGEGLRLTHVTRNLDAPAAYTNLSGRVDRWHIVEYYAPNYFYIRYNTVDSQPGEIEIDTTDSWDVYHAITPETETTSHDFWGNVVPGHIFSGDAAEEFERQIQQVIHEDMVMYEMQQKCVLNDPRSTSIDVHPRGYRVEDKVFLQARRLLERRIQTEQEMQRAAA